MKLYYSHNCGPRVTVAVARHINAPVEFIRANPTDPAQKAFYTPLNPNRRVPILVEGDRTLWEADAIVCRLCQITGSDFWPSDALYQRPHQLTFAHGRWVIEAIALGSLAKKFQALQQVSTMSS